MKRSLSIGIALALLLCGLAALAESDYTYYPESEEYVGLWLAGDDCELEICHMDDDYNLFNCIVTRYTGENEGVRWIYDACAYDDVGKALASLEIGQKLAITLDGDGELVSSERIYDDGAAAFALNDDGALVWTDFKETPGEDETTFTRAPGDPEPIPADALADGCLRVIGGVEQGTAGASLKQALAACEVGGFVAGYDLTRADRDGLTACVRDALERLSDEERAALAENFPGVAAQLDDCFQNWEANRALFEDAGAADDMESLAYDSAVRASWLRLRDEIESQLGESDAK